MILLSSSHNSKGQWATSIWRCQKWAMGSTRLRNTGLGQWFPTWVRSNPRGSVSQSQGFGGGHTHTHTRHTHIIFYFSNYEGFGECTDETCGVQYLQQG